MPPSLSALQSSTLFAPPRAAAIADSTESMQISTFIVSVYVLSGRAKPPADTNEANQVVSLVLFGNQ